MASNVLSEQSNEDSPNFSLKNVGKFWILKTNNISKRLLFLDNAKDVAINENILIADEKIFEIHTNKKGEYLFHKIEDVPYETYFSMKETTREKIDVKKEMTEEIDKSKYDWNQDKTQFETPYTEPFYDEIGELTTTNVKVEKDTLTVKYEEVGKSDTEKELYDAKRSCLSDVDEACFEEGKEEYRPLYSGSTEADEDIKVTEMPSTSPEGQEFEVDVEKSDLIKRCGIEGKMILSILDTYISFKDPNTHREIYKFKLPWVKRYGKNQSLSLFLLEVGRKCPMGSGTVLCKTQIADQIQMAVQQRCLEIKKARTVSYADQT